MNAVPIIGIDLGTTNSLVAVTDAAGPRVIPDEHGRPLLPSVVRYHVESGRAVVSAVGDNARKPSENTGIVVSSVKRLMGRSIADAAADLPYLPYQVVEGEHRTARVAIPGVPTALSPQEVSAAVLRVLKDRASRELGVEVTKAVITVPAYFDDAQRQATRDAGRLAGLDVLRIVNEPTAAALAYGLGVGHRQKPRGPGVVAVYDLGGGTFDISILRITPSTDPSQPAFFQVLSTAGDTHLGGDDFDHALIDLLAPGDRPAEHAGTIKALAERVKIALSDHPWVDVDERIGPVLISRRVTREEFEALIAPLVERTMTACDRAVRDARKQMGGETIGAVVMVGGSTRVPMVRRRVREVFAVEPYTAINPDLVVALGAAVQAGILSGQDRGALLLDVVPLSLGVETVGGAVAKIIFRNSTVPTRATEMFSTGVDNQTGITLNIVQGEREMAADCRSLGRFTLRGIPPMKAGLPQVEVEFLVDANGVLNVSAVERLSGTRAALQVVPNHGLTRDEVDRIEREALIHAREDMTRHRVVDLIAASKLDLAWIGESFDKHAHQLEPAMRDEVSGKMVALRMFVAQAERDWRAVDPAMFDRAKRGLEASALRLQEIAVTAALRDAKKG